MHMMVNEVSVQIVVLTCTQSEFRGDVSFLGQYSYVPVLKLEKKTILLPVDVAFWGV